MDIIDEALARIADHARDAAHRAWTDAQDREDEQHAAAEADAVHEVQHARVARSGLLLDATIGWEHEYVGLLIHAALQYAAADATDKPNYVAELERAAELMGDAVIVKRRQQILCSRGQA